MRTVVLFENMQVFLLHVLNKNENILNAGYRVLSEIAKLVSSEKN